MSARMLASTFFVGALAASLDARAQDHAHHGMPPQEHAQQQLAQPPTQQPSPTAIAPEQPMDHARMDHAATQHPTAPAQGQPVTPIPELTDADRAAAQPPSHVHPVHDNGVHSLVRLDRFEAVDTDAGTGLEWKGQAWIGTDTDRLWLRSEGRRDDGRTQAAEIEAMYGRPVSRWWDLLVGVRHDFKPGASQDFAAIGVTGIAPYKFEVQATAYAGSGGRTAARLEVEYETLLTNRLILQPMLEAEFSGEADAARGIGSGLTTMETGLRLRYEIVRRFAPYVGVSYERAFGGTAEFRARQGRETRGAHLVAGVRVWF
jgi:copper resistance protein B